MSGCNVLISSAGRRVALLRSFRQALEASGIAGKVYASDLSPTTAAGHAADSLFLVPPCRSEGFVPAMLELCETHRIALVVPTIDTELAAYAAHRDDFAAIGTTVAISGPETVAIAADKRRTNEWLSAHGFPTVRQAPAATVRAAPEDWSFPVIAKPAAGSASAGVSLVSDPSQLPDGPDVIVEERAPGVEHTVDAYVDGDGEVLTTVPRKRLEVRAGEVSKAVTVRHPELQSLVTDIVRQLPETRGALNVQVFVADDRLSVIEINPRFGGGYPLSWQAGARFPQWLVEEIVGRRPTVSSWREGVAMLRFDDAVFVDAREIEP
jgi:carbamoyl-phosphate synthase large subunit